MLDAIKNMQPMYRYALIALVVLVVVLVAYFATRNKGSEYFSAANNINLAIPESTAKGTVQYPSGGPYYGYWRINSILRDTGYEVTSLTSDADNYWLRYRTPQWLLRWADFDRRGFNAPENRFDVTKMNYAIREIIPYFSADLYYYYLPGKWSQMVNPTHPTTGQSLRPSDISEWLNNESNFRQLTSAPAPGLPDGRYDVHPPIQDVSSASPLA